MIYDPGKFIKNSFGQVSYFPDPRLQKDLSSVWWWKHKRAYDYMQKEINHFWSHVWDGDKDIPYDL